MKLSLSLQFPSALLAFACTAAAGYSQTQKTLAPIRTPETIGTQADLKFVVVVTRHGVRSPTGKLDQLNQYSAQPWPAWSVPPGNLTEHGAKLMTLFGSYDRELWIHEGLLTGAACDDAGRIAILADSDQRTRETGKALAKGVMPGCPVETHALPEGTPDPLFHPLELGIVHVDKQLATAAIAGRIANNPGGLAQEYRLQLAALEDILSTQSSGADRKPNAKDMPARKSLLDIPSSLAPGKADHLVDLRSPLGTAATISENLLLEYSEGMPEVGWGKVDAQRLRDLMQLHTANSDLERRTPYIAQALASNLLSHILDSMQQAVTQQPVAGALNDTSTRVLILVGHDTNLANISGALDLSWLTDGRRDDTPPGGGLVFELWQQRGTASYSIRTYYTAQSLDQMRNATPLTLTQPPDRAALFVPGCSDAEMSCSWTSFQSTVRSAIDPRSVR